MDAMTDDRPPFSLTPWVRRLLAANGTVYLLQLTVFTSPWLVDTFGFSAADLARRPWTLFTYAFLHGSLLHLLGNMLGLVVFGPQVERRHGGACFLRLYLLAALGGALLSLALLPLAGDALIIGASGAVFGVMMAFVLAWPDAPIYIFPFPVPIRARWLVLGLAAFSLIAGVRGADRGVAHFAHLGGFLAAWLYVRASQRLRGPAPARPAERAPAVLVRPSAGEVLRRRATPGTGPASRHSADAVRAEVDRVLDKISQRGLGSLTPDERRFLDEMSERFRRDR
jgi:membrane associated rhomboid family serine protease